MKEKITNNFNECGRLWKEEMRKVRVIARLLWLVRVDGARVRVVLRRAGKELEGDQSTAGEGRGASSGYAQSKLTLRRLIGVSLQTSHCFTSSPLRVSYFKAAVR